jgi:lysyl-tRNA synthetase class II
MVVRFIEGGRERLNASPEFRARMREQEAEIRLRYVELLADAAFFQRWLIRRRMVREIGNLRPSRRSLW